MKPKTHKKVKKKKSLFHFCAQIIAIQLSPRIVRKKRKEDTPPATRGHRTARLVKERERKKERKKDGRTARVVVVVQARGGGSFSKRELNCDRDGVLNGLI